MSKFLNDTVRMRAASMILSRVRWPQKIVTAGTFAIWFCLFGAGAVLATDGPSKQADSDSGETAMAEFKRITRLSEQEVYSKYIHESFYYSSLSDTNNPGKLTLQEKRAVKIKVENHAFFLHRFTTRAGEQADVEIYVSEDGKRVLCSRKRGSQIAFNAQYSTWNTS